MAALGTVALFSLSSLTGSLEKITNDSLPGLYLANQLATIAKDQRANMITHIAAADKAEMGNIEAEIATQGSEFESSLQAYAKTALTPRSQELASRVRPAHTGLLEIWQQILPLSRAGDTKAALELWNREGLPAARARAATLKALADFNKTAGDQDSATATASAVRAKTWIWIVFALAIGSSVTLAIFNIRSIVGPLDKAVSRLRDNAAQVASAARQVSSSSQTLAQGASEQAASVEETSAATEEITAMARKNSDHAPAAGSEVDAVTADIAVANRNLESMTESMHGIESAASKMATIIQVIDQIAFQTNILALNAAVEAARAGDAGMGFAVVAGEVGTLAQRSADSARDTAALIEEAIATTRAGVSQLHTLTESVHTITERSARVRDLVQHVTQGSHEQARGASEIAGALTQMDSATQNVAANAEESAAASEELSGQAVALMDVVKQLDAMVHAQTT